MSVDRSSDHVIPPLTVASVTVCVRRFSETYGKSYKEFKLYAKAFDKVAFLTTSTMTTEEKFHAAVDVVNSLPQNGPFQPSDDLMLKFYAYYKQATLGPCCIPKPSFWEATARNKWTAWNELGAMRKQLAMEKYIEELAKVIETMSYNEKVSKFISSMAPFYEVVCTDENDLPESDVNTKNVKNENLEKNISDGLPNSRTAFPTEQNLSPPTQLDERCSKHYQPQQCMESFSFNAGISNTGRKSSSDNSSTVTSEGRLSSSESSDSESSPVTEEDVSEMFRRRKILKNLPISSTKDLLILTVINMHSSLEDIVKHLERLERLASTAELSQKEIKCENIESYSWSLPGTALIVLWPLAVHWCLNHIRSSLERN